MLADIALLGVATASLASWLVSRVQEVEETTQTATGCDVEALTREIAAMRDDLAKDRERRK